MQIPSYLMVILLFVLYYLFLIIIEKKLMSEPKDIIRKVLSVAFFYAGISLVYYSLTGSPFLSGDIKEYNFYIFMIGFIALVWAVPELLCEFKYFKQFFKKNKIV